MAVTTNSPSPFNPGRNNDLPVRNAPIPPGETGYDSKDRGAGIEDPNRTRQDPPLDRTQPVNNLQREDFNTAEADKAARAVDPKSKARRETGEPLAKTTDKSQSDRVPAGHAAQDKARTEDPASHEPAKNGDTSRRSTDSDTANRTGQKTGTEAHKAADHKTQAKR